MRTPITSATHAEEVPLESLRDALAQREAHAASMTAPTEVTAEGSLRAMQTAVAIAERDALDDMRSAVALLEYEFIWELRSRGMTWEQMGKVFGLTGSAVRYRLLTAQPPAEESVSPEIVAIVREAIRSRTAARLLGGFDTDKDIARRNSFTDVYVAIAALQREAIHTLREQGFIWADIAAIYGMTPSSVIARSLSPEATSQRRAAAAYRSPLAQPPGVSPDQVAAALGVSRGWVADRLDLPGIESIEYQHGSRKLIRILTPIDEFKRLAA